MSKFYQTPGADSFAQCKVAMNFQSEKIQYLGSAMK